MPRVSGRRFREQCRRGPTTELHKAAFHGDTERTLGLLSSGSIDIDDIDLMGFSPLIYSAGAGHARVVKILLNKGADTSIVAGGCTAVHVSAQEGHVAATAMLTNAGADLEVMDSQGYTPLHLAVENGDWGVIRVLIQGGANVNCRSSKEGHTPLHICASLGKTFATRELLRAKANALLTTPRLSGMTVVPLELAAASGHSDVVRELIQQAGIKGCGGASGGETALQIAAQDQCMAIMATLTEAGVVDTGTALSTATCYGRKASAKFLLQQQEARNPTGRDAYLRARDSTGRTPLFCCIEFCPSPRMVRLLIDAGADTSAAVKIAKPLGTGVFNSTPLAWTKLHLEVLKTVNGQPATEEQLDKLRAIRRLLLRVEAVYAISWLWPGDASFIARAAAAAEGSRGINNNTSTTPLTASPLRAMLPVLRERARRRGVLMAAQFRSVVGNVGTYIGWDASCLCCVCFVCVFPCRLFSVVCSCAQ